MKKSTYILIVIVGCLIATCLIFVWPYLSEYVNNHFLSTHNLIEELSTLR